MTKWSSATLHLRSSAPPCIHKMKKKRTKTTWGNSQIQILLSKTKHLCISFHFRYHRMSCRCLQRTRLSSTDSAVSHHRVSTEPQWRVKKGIFIWLPSATKSCTPDLYKDHVGGCSLCHCWTALRSTEWCFYYFGYPFLINEGRLKSRGWHPYNFSNQDLFLSYPVKKGAITCWTTVPLHFDHFKDSA